VSVSLDNDFDGYASNSVGGPDCNDSNPNINPGVAENCSDDIDNNCNGLIDAQETDVDGDGYNPCTGDCNENDATINPGATEQCDNKDNNCNVQTDEGCDDDNDNYCDKNMVTVGTPSTCTFGGNDCNDTNPNIKPGVTELCDGVDNNCDGKTDYASTMGDLDNSCGSDSSCSWNSCSGNCTRSGGTYTDYYCNEGVGCSSQPVACSNQNCPAGTQCSAGSCISASEVCNGVDDDCNGRTDYINTAGDLDNSCGSDTTCSWTSCSGNCTRTGGSWTDYYCNEGVGCVFQSVACSNQTCSAGTRCSSGSCVGATETCNGIDDDCNGRTDYINTAGDLDNSCGTDTSCGSINSGCTGDGCQYIGAYTDYYCNEGVGCASGTPSCGTLRCSVGNRCSGSSCVADDTQESCSDSSPGCLVDSNLDDCQNSWIWWTGLRSTKVGSTSDNDYYYFTVVDNINTCTGPQPYIWLALSNTANDYDIDAEVWYVCNTGSASVACGGTTGSQIASNRCKGGAAGDTSEGVWLQSVDCSGTTDESGTVYIWVYPDSSPNCEAYDLGYRANYY